MPEGISFGQISRPTYALLEELSYAQIVVPIDC